MPQLVPPGPGKARSRPAVTGRRFAITALAAGAVATTMVIPASASAAPKATKKPAITVKPASKLPASRKQVTVKGKKFAPARNGGAGIYLVFGPKTKSFSTNASLYYSAKWVHPGAKAGPGQAVLKKNGTFATSLPVKATYTDGNGKKVNCRKTACYVLTFTAHGIPDRSQDTAKRVMFK